MCSAEQQAQDQKAKLAAISLHPNSNPNPNFYPNVQR